MFNWNYCYGRRKSCFNHVAKKKKKKLKSKVIVIVIFTIFSGYSVWWNETMLPQVLQYAQDKIQNCNKLHAYNMKSQYSFDLKYTCAIVQTFSTVQITSILCKTVVEIPLCVPLIDRSNASPFTQRLKPIPLFSTWVAVNGFIKVLLDNSKPCDPLTPSWRVICCSLE